MVRALCNCPACGSEGADVVAQLDAARRERFLAYSEIKYGGLLNDWLGEIEPIILRCRQCGHCWYKYHPGPEKLGLMYASGRRLLPNVPMSREPSGHMRKEMVKLRRLVKFPGSPSLLDYGSGYGRWARAAVAAGFKVTAFEPSAERGAENQVPFEIVHTLDAIRGQRFAAIQMEQVLEHVTAPLTVLRDIKAFCDSATIIRITVPNILRSHEGAAIWERWPYNGISTHTMAPFEHLHGFTPRSLDCLLKRAGFKSVSAILLLRYYPTVSASVFLDKIISSMGRTMRIVVPV